MAEPVSRGADVVAVGETMIVLIPEPWPPGCM